MPVWSNGKLMFKVWSGPLAMSSNQLHLLTDCRSYSPTWKFYNFLPWLANSVLFLWKWKQSKKLHHLPNSKSTILEASLLLFTVLHPLNGWDTVYLFSTVLLLLCTFSPCHQYFPLESVHSAHKNETNFFDSTQSFNFCSLLENLMPVFPYAYRNIFRSPYFHSSSGFPVILLVEWACMRMCPPKGPYVKARFPGRHYWEILWTCKRLGLVEGVLWSLEVCPQKGLWDSAVFLSVSRPDMWALTLTCKGPKHKAIQSWTLISKTEAKQTLLHKEPVLSI